MSDICIGVILELWEGSGANPMEVWPGIHLTGLGGSRFRQYGSVDGRHVPGDVEHLYLRLFHLI
jgi:hypothetical protein